jgi:hypothetical protein
LLPRLETDRPGGTPDKKGKHRLPFLEIGAGNEVRTRDLNLGKVALYQLSYSRAIADSKLHETTNIIVAKEMRLLRVWLRWLSIIQPPPVGAC